MDTGYIQLIDDATKTRVLEIGKSLCPDGFIAGAYVRDTAGDAYNRDAYMREADVIAAHGGTPIVVTSYGLSGLEEDDWLNALNEIGECAGQFYAFELGPQFVPFGRIYSWLLTKQIPQQANRITTHIHHGPTRQIIF